MQVRRIPVQRIVLILSIQAQHVRFQKGRTPSQDNAMLQDGQSARPFASIRLGGSILVTVFQGLQLRDRRDFSWCPSSQKVSSVVRDGRRSENFSDDSPVDAPVCL